MIRSVGSRQILRDRILNARIFQMEQQVVAGRHPAHRSLGGWPLGRQQVR